MASAREWGSVSAGPVVSVITPVYNGRDFIEECIESVLAQTYRTFEYLISDNHCDDGTSEVIGRYAAQDPRIRVVRPDGFLQPLAHSNFAVHHCSPGSVYLKFVHADDTIMPTCLERMVTVAEEHPSIGLVGALRVNGEDVVDLDGVPPGIDVVPGRWLLRSELRGAPYTTGTPTSTMIRLDAARRGRDGLYDESYIHADDALSYTLLAESDFGYIAEPLTRTRFRPGSITSWADHLGTWTPEHLRMVLEFGPEVLTRSELERAAGRLERRYAIMLVKWTATLRFLRDREALRFHRNALAHIERASRAAGRPMPASLLVYARTLGRLSTRAR